MLAATSHQVEVRHRREVIDPPSHRILRADLSIGFQEPMADRFRPRSQATRGSQDLAGQTLSSSPAVTLMA